MSHLTSGNALGFLLTDTARLFRQFFERSVTENGLGLTPGEVRALGHAMRFDGSRQAVLADRMGVEPMTLSAYLDRLEARGLIERTVDPSDRRAKIVRPTAAATEIMRQLDPLFETVYVQATKGLTDSQADAMTEALAIVRANLTNDSVLLAKLDLLSEHAGAAARAGGPGTRAQA